MKIIITAIIFSIVSHGSAAWAEGWDNALSRLDVKELSASAGAQANWLPPVSGKVIVLPAPASPAGGPCATLPSALAIADSSAYDAQTITCLSGLAAIPDYVSPLAVVPAPAQLTKGETAAVNKYVDSYAYIVNAALRKGEGVSKYRKFIDTLDSALRKMPVYTGVTFRGSAFPPVTENKLVSDTVYTDPAFLSTSRNLAVAEGYTGTNGYLSVILSKTGRQISYTSSIDELGTEMEVLFPTDTSLRVIAASPRPDGITIVYLEELPKNL